MAIGNENLVNRDEEQLALKIIGAIKGIKYVTVQITVHNARVTQIDKIERIRITKEESTEKDS